RARRAPPPRTSPSSADAAAAFVPREDGPPGAIPGGRFASGGSSSRVVLGSELDRRAPVPRVAHPDLPRPAAHRTVLHVALPRAAPGIQPERGKLPAVGADHVGALLRRSLAQREL